MARYRRPRALSQRNDPSEPHIRHENANCSPTSGAAALDYHTGGIVRKRGGDLRHLLPNPETGVNPGTTLSLEDVRIAWKRLGQVLTISQGWEAIKLRRREGRCIIIQGDSGDLDRSCSESQDVAHAVLLHPDDGPAGDWLIMDPWCYVAGSNGLGKWRWIDRDDIYAYAKALGFRFAFTRRQPKLP